MEIMYTAVFAVKSELIFFLSNFKNSTAGTISRRFCLTSLVT